MNTQKIDKRSNGDYQREVDEMIVRKNVYYCASYIVAKISEYEPDEWFNLFMNEDYTEAATENVYALDMTSHDDRDTLLENMEYVDHEWNKKKTMKYIQKEFSEELQTDEDMARTYCDFVNIDPHQIEIFEHWIVSDWLARQLEKRGEVIEHDFHGLTIWGRCTTGQAILLDGVICDIYDKEIIK